jgi:2-oxoglutarate ferredoxin oxidoreductase subunit beta
MNELSTKVFPTWCPGCGNFGLWAAFKSAATIEGWDNTNTQITAGIGCHGHIINFVKLTSFEGLHGRAIPVASGIKYTNNKLNVFVFTGDGDCLGEGGNHFIHACRRNQNITVLLHNNSIYGLTTGQTSPTTPHGFKSKTTPFGNFDKPLSPASLAITSGATFVSRCFSNDIKKLSDLIISANNHRGMSVIEILQPCITYNNECGASFYKENIYDLSADYDPSDKVKAFEKSLEWGPKQIPVGIIYKEDRPTAEEEFSTDKDFTLVDNNLKARDITELLAKLH